MTKTVVEVTFAWETLGDIALTSTGKLGFPNTPSEPGVYRLRVWSEATETYVGESSHLYRRFEHDYKYQPSGSTNVWVRAWLTRCITEGKRAELSVMADPRVVIDGEDVPHSLGKEADRKLLEAAAVGAAVQAGESVQNKFKES